jgi:hypothetical protein
VFGAKMPVRLAPAQSRPFSQLVQAHWRQVNPAAWAADHRRRHREFRRLLLPRYPLLSAGLIGLLYAVHGVFWALGAPLPAEELKKVNPLAVANGVVIVLLYAAYFGWLRRAFEVPA